MPMENKKLTVSASTNGTISNQHDEFLLTNIVHFLLQLILFILQIRFQNLTPFTLLINAMGFFYFGTLCKPRVDNVYL